MTTTITNFVNNIDVTYPIPGVDNDTQGFRDNFANIKNALKSATEMLSNIEKNAPSLTDTSDYGFTGIAYRPILKSYGEQASSTDSDTETNGLLSVNYLNGSYQTVSLTKDSTITVTDWPPNNILGKVRVNIQNNSTTTNFNLNMYVPTGSTLIKSNSLDFPYVISTSTSTANVMFDIWSSDNGKNVFINRVLDTTEIMSADVESASVVTNPSQSAITSLGNLTHLNIGGSTIKLSSNISPKKLIISGVDGLVIDTGREIDANLVDFDSTGYPGPLHNQVILSSVNGIEIGSTFKFYPTESDTHIVASIDTENKKITTIDGWDPVELINLHGVTTGTTITFNISAASDSLTYSPSAPDTLKGSSYDKKGKIIGSADGIYLCYENYSDGINNIWTYAPSKATQNRVKPQSATTNTNKGYVEYDLSISNSFFHSDVLTGNITPLVSNLPTEPAQIDLKITVSNGNETYLVCPDNILLGNTTTNYLKNVYWKQVSTTGTNTTLTSVATIPPMPNTKSVYRFTIVGTGGTVESSSWTILGERDDYV